MKGGALKGSGALKGLKGSVKNLSCQVHKVRLLTTKARHQVTMRLPHLHPPPIRAPTFPRGKDADAVARQVVLSGITNMIALQMFHPRFIRTNRGRMIRAVNLVLTLTLVQCSKIFLPKTETYTTVWSIQWCLDLRSVPHPSSMPSLLVMPVLLNRPCPLSFSVKIILV